MFWVGFLLIQATVVACIMIGSSFTTFVNAPSLLLTFIGGQLAVWMVHGKQSVEVLTPSFAKNNPKQGIIIAGTARRAYVTVGWIGVLIGSIQMGAGLDDLSSFGPAFAVLMLCPFYGHLMEFSIWMPLERVMMVQAQSLES